MIDKDAHYQSFVHRYCKLSVIIPDPVIFRNCPLSACIYCLFHAFFLQPSELIKAPHPITGEIQVRKIHKRWYIFLFSSGRSSSFSLPLSVCLIPTCFFPSAPDQLWQELGKPDCTCAAGQEPGPEGQRQLLGPFCQGLPLAWARVSSRSSASLLEYPFCVSLSASVSVWLSLPSFLSDLVSTAQFWNWLTDSVCMREWEWIRWHEAVIPVSP